MRTVSSQQPSAADTGMFRSSSSSSAEELTRRLPRPNGRPKFDRTPFKTCPRCVAFILLRSSPVQSSVHIELLCQTIDCKLHSKWTVPGDNDSRSSPEKTVDGSAARQYTRQRTAHDHNQPTTKAAFGLGASSAIFIAVVGSVPGHCLINANNAYARPCSGVIRSIIEE